MGLAKQKIDEEKYRSAEQILKALYERWPNGLEAPEAVVAHAEILKKRKKWDDAFNYTNIAIDNYSNRLKGYSDVLNGQFELAMSVMETTTNDISVRGLSDSGDGNSLF